LTVSLGLGLTLLITLAGTASSILAEIDTTVPKKAPALFLVDIPRAEERRFLALAHADLPGAELRLVPSLRGPVTAVKGVQVTEMRDIPEGAWILRGDRGSTFARDLPPANRIVAGQWWAKDYRGPPLLASIKMPPQRSNSGWRRADGHRAGPADRSKDCLAARNRLAEHGLQFCDHLRTGDVGSRALYADGDYRPTVKDVDCRV
jgi:hypothetical protein